MSRITARLALALVVVLLGTSGPMAATVGPAGDDSTVATPLLLTEASTAIPGLSYTAHVATSADVQALMGAMGVRQEGVDYNVLYGEFGTGLAPPTAEQYDAMVGEVKLYDSASLGQGLELPSTVDHSKEGIFPTVGNQASQGSCAAWATSYYTNGYLQAKDNDWTDANAGTNKSHLMSPAWCYNKVNGGYDSGSSWWDNTAIMMDLGNADMASHTYNAGDLYGWGNETAWRSAPRYRIAEEIDYASPSSTAVIKSWVAEGYVCPLALNAGNYGYIGPDGVLNSVEHQGGYANHANTIVGYNDSIVAGNDVGAFHIVNSWGKSWGWSGYYWMTYAAVAELYYSIMRFHDRVDYEPSLLATWEQSVQGSKDTWVFVETDSGLYADVDPWWDAGSATKFPTFMCYDVSSLAEDIGLAEYCLYYGTGTTTGTVSKFSLEWYQGGYVPSRPDLTVLSDDAPLKGAARLYASFNGVHINVTSPGSGLWHAGNVTVEGTANPYAPEMVRDEDFEAAWKDYWTREDMDAGSGTDTWGWSTGRARSGARSVWCAGGDQGTIYAQTFDSGGSIPSGWKVASDGPNQYPFAFVNSGYRGCGGSDYLALANGNRGAGTNMTERLYMSSPFDARGWTGLQLRFYLDYDYYDGDERAEVLYANGSTYPTFTSALNWTADFFGTKTVDLSSQDGERQLYIAFRYHASADRYIAVDDVVVTGLREEYDTDMLANVFLSSLDLDGFDNVTLEYAYWVDSEQGVDVLSAMYRESASAAWNLLSNHSGGSAGWVEVELEVPTNATQLGFRFVSNGSVVGEGAYLDDVVLTGRHALDGIELKVDGAGYSPFAQGADWAGTWDSTAYTDGQHMLSVRALYGARDDVDSRLVLVDNTPPTVSGTWCSQVTTGDRFHAGVNATDVNPVGAVAMHYRYTGIGGPGEERVENATALVPGQWDAFLDAPSDAVVIDLRFWVEDSLGNGVFSNPLHAPVLDNDAPALGEDLTPASATTGDPLTFTTSATDNIGVVLMRVEYWYGAGAERQEHTSDGGAIAATIDVLHTTEPLHYRLSAVDGAGNRVTGEERAVPVLDNDLPALWRDWTPENATTGEDVTLMVSVSDNIAVGGAWAEWRFDDEGSTISTLEPLGDGVYRLVLLVPWGSIEPLRYVFRANDSSGNWNATVERSVAVLDNDAPWLGADLTPAGASTGDAFTFSLELLDNIAIGSVRVEYWYGGGEHVTVDAAPSPGGPASWAATITVMDTVEPFWYLVHFADTSLNQNFTEMRTVAVLDNDAPVIASDSSPEWVPTGTAYTFEVEVLDNIGVGSVVVWYWFDALPHQSQVLTGVDLTGLWNGTYALTIVTPSDSTAELHYLFEVSDLSENWARSDERIAEVRDITSPVADAGPDVVIDQHERAALDGTGSADNVGLASLVWTVLVGGEPVTLSGPTSGLTLDEAGTYEATLVVEDPSGNTATDTVTITVRDITAPVAVADGDRTIDQGGAAALSGEGSSDNVGVVSWTWTFEYGGAPVSMEGAIASYTFSSPGLYTVTLTVADAALNTDTESYELKVRDTVVPVPMSLKDREAKKGAEVELDGTASTDNVGIVNWTWRIRMEGESSFREVYGPLTSYRFDAPGTHTVTLVVRDADGNVAESEPFTVEVPNVALWLTIIIIIAAAVALALVAAARRRRRRDR